MSDLTLRLQDLVENPSPRVAVCLVLDSSVSMGPKWVYPDWVIQRGTYADEGWLHVPAELAHHGTPDPNWTPPIEELNKGIQRFFKVLREDEVARWSAEVAVVTFGGQAELILDFDDINRQVAPNLTAQGNTPMGLALETALDTLDRRKHEYKDAGVDYFQPWLVLMTDGTPSDDISNAIRRMHRLEKQRKLSIFPIAVGSEVQLDVLAGLSSRRPPLRLRGLRFESFFEWLSKSIIATSHSTPGEQVPLDLEGVRAWADL